MSSNRFPGKVLAPFRGEPIILHVVRRLARVISLSDIVVTTSSEISDDPLVTYLKSVDINVFRGPLNDVFDRFRLCLDEHHCDWILRVSGDSPLLEPNVVRAVINESDRGDCDLVSTISPRTFPKGQNAELIRASLFNSVRTDQLTATDKEHVTPFFYKRLREYRICSVKSGLPDLVRLSLAVDTVEDLRRIESLTKKDHQQILGDWSSAE